MCVCVCVCVYDIYTRVLIYIFFCLDIARDRMNEAPNETRTHS